ncbi:MAG: hypothetical protein ACLFRT_13755, partial [Actinomycetota bacterium]
MRALLLEPNGRHGLGWALLDRVIAECFPDLHPAAFGASVRTEVQRAETRVDIVIGGDTVTVD